MSMAGHIFNEADPFVRAVAKALDDDPALFSDVPIDPKHLALRQDRVMAYHALHYALSSLTSRVADCLMAEQAGTVMDAMQVVRQVRSEAAQPFVRPDYNRRRLAMLVAESVLKRRQARKQRVGRDRAAKANKR